MEQRGTATVPGAFVALCCALLLGACGPAPTDGSDAQVTRLGKIEVTAQLVEIPESFAALAKYDYDFALVMQYRVLEVHRGELESETLFVGHYNPLAPRSEASDARIDGIGGDLDRFREGDRHRLALEVPIEDYCMAGIINKYFDQDIGPVYWALWTNRVVN